MRSLPNWRPSDLEQREGRGVRQGNEWSDVFIFRYVTEGRNNQAGFDSFLWQAIENKRRIISQVMSDDLHEIRLKLSQCLGLYWSAIAVCKKVRTRSKMERELKVKKWEQHIQKI